MRKILTICFVTLLFGTTLFAQGSIRGMVYEKSTDLPLEFVNVAVKNIKDNSILRGATSDNKGAFAIDGLPYGKYALSYSFIGFDDVPADTVVVDAKQKKVDVGKLYLSESSQSLKEVEIVGQKSTFVNSIDRKTFNVGQDLMSKTGSVSDLMQNIPSVQVDIDGNVSLRGSDNVTILINGRPSSLMGANRAAVLQQMPANTIDKIEIITNPSAKYKPDGTSGIINIVTKKDKGTGLNGSVAANAGNQQRYNGNVLLNYNPGKLSLSGSYSIRQDDRFRLTDDKRTRYQQNPDTTSYYLLHAEDKARPLSHIVHGGVDYQLTKVDKIGASGSYNYRSFTRSAMDQNSYMDADMNLTKRYDRLRTDPEFEDDLEVAAYYQHAFAKEGHQLSADYTASRSLEQEDNRYSNVYYIPQEPTTYDNTLIKQGGTESLLAVEYANPIGEDITFEAGYNLESTNSDLDFFGEYYDVALGNWVDDVEKTNHFIYTQNIHVLYSTYEQELGNFGFMGGLRAEQAFVNSNQVTNDTVVKNNYFRLYPSLHLSYQLTDVHQLQLNYSHRINRPEGDDMNPFPEYQDPYNLKVGNPHLKPADIHSVEMGYQFQQNNATFLSTLYYRYTYNGMSEIATFINDSVKVTSKQNLSKSRSAGVELIYSANIGRWATLNLSTNTYYNTIDASNLGYSNNKSTVAWSASFSGGFNLTKSSVLQITSNYQAKRLTPQGTQLPSFVLNTGFKQEVFNKKGAVIVTVSDVFNSMRSNTVIDTPELYETINRKRSARMVYAGFTYTFGNNKKKESSIKFDNSL